jgi:2-amino-4-hydroxy-6-hydroxymethyldihydropteridine diphosphokinase
LVCKFANQNTLFTQKMLYLLLGSNVGNCLEYLANACSQIEQKIGKINKQSAIYQTAAWGLEQQDDFLNMAIEVETYIDAFEILAQIHQIETDLGRKRLQFWGARTIDIDIIFYDQQIISTQTLTIPHSRILERRFVLVPLSEIAPEFIHPVWEMPIKKMLEICEDKLVVEIFGKTFATENIK